MSTTPCESHNTVTMTFPAHGAIFLFLWHTFKCFCPLLRLSCLMVYLCFNCCYKTQKKISVIAFKAGQILLRNVNSLPFLIDVQQTGTNRADCFFIHKTSCNVYRTWSFQMFVISDLHIFCIFQSAL